MHRHVRQLHMIATPIPFLRNLITPNNNMMPPMQTQKVKRRKGSRNTPRIRMPQVRLKLSEEHNPSQTSNSVSGVIWFSIEGEGMRERGIHRMKKRIHSMVCRIQPQRGYHFRKWFGFLPGLNLRFRCPRHGGLLVQGGGRRQSPMDRCPNPFDGVWVIMDW